jgi:pimeloyl-ACP methyl ester carboxylesterase
MTDLAADLAALLDQLGIAGAVVAGHSMGGYVALAFARAYPERVLGLGLVASQAVADPPDRKAARYQAAEQVEKNGVADVAASMPGKLTADAGLQAKLKELIARQTPAAVAAALRAMAERPDATPALAGFDFPVACVHGLADELIPIERAYEVKKAARHGHVMGIESAGHMPMMEAAEATARGLVKFLGSDPEREKKSLKAGGMGIGIAVGVLIGIGFGIVADNLAIGLAVGLPIGVVLGSWLRRRISV